MDTIVTYLTALRGKMFKLLPMRESYDKGIDNHLYEYLSNLYDNCVGAFLCFPELSEKSMLIEVQNNIAFLKDAEDIKFSKWRSIVLRSTRLIHEVLDDYQEEV